jgi:hypothetical protein
MTYCKGDTPADVSVALYLDDQTTITAETGGRGYLRGGGPWSFVIDGQRYLQTSDAFARLFGPAAAQVGLPDAPFDLTLAPASGCEIQLYSPILSGAYHP